MNEPLKTPQDHFNEGMRSGLWVGALITASALAVVGGLVSWLCF